MKKKPAGIVNRRATFDYDLNDELVVGLVLTGAETKAARLKHVQLKGSYVTIKADQLWLVNASFSVNSNVKGDKNTVDTRDRKLLAHRKQIEQLQEAKKQGLAIIPKRLLTDGRFIKLAIATGRGKKHYDKRAAIKKKDLQRENARKVSL
jgi:SsrA-binding protein